MQFGDCPQGRSYKFLISPGAIPVFPDQISLQFLLVFDCSLVSAMGFLLK